MLGSKSKSLAATICKPCDVNILAAIPSETEPKGLTRVVVVKPEVVVYFGLLSILTQVGVAESEKRVAAIFLLPVCALEPPKHSFLP